MIKKIKKETIKKVKTKRDTAQEAHEVFNPDMHEPIDSFFNENFSFDNKVFFEPPVGGDMKSEEAWLGKDFEGQLSVDVFSTENEIVIKSTIAGVRSEDLDIFVDNDMITIRGKRVKQEEVAEKNYYYQECFWGGFSRSIILPEEVQTDHIDAILKDGILTVTLPKANKKKKIDIQVIEE